MKGPNFKNVELTKDFEKNGFVRIPRFFNSNQIKSLKDLYLSVAEEHDNVNFPFVSTSHSNNSQLINKVNNGIIEIISPSLHQTFTDFQILFSNFLLKKPVENSITDFHEDVTLVDESQYLSYSIWFPLTDVSEENGTMYFIPKSHLFPTYFRTNPYNKSRYRNLNKLLFQYKKVEHCQSGDAIVFAHKTIHGSFKNQSSENRVAGVLAMHPKEANLYHYHLYEEEKKVNCYEMTIDDFINLDKSIAPKNAPFVQSYPWEDKIYSEKEFLNLIGESYWKYLLKKWI